MAGKGQIKDLVGQTFGSLTVIAYAGKYRGTRTSAWLCRCECGTERIADGGNLRPTTRAGCGCKYLNRKRHGLSKKPIYAVWLSMLARCNNPNNTSFHRYGGRGITVCDRWRVFANFLADMGEQNGTVERIDNSGNYEPSNCRWASRTEQANNTRRNRKVPIAGGKTASIAEAAKLAGITYAGMQYRRKVNMPPEKIVQKNMRKRRSSTTC